jgi:hypothetical protein
MVSGAPGWVWFLLLALIVLGMRRLRTRVTPVVVAVIPLLAFLAWSVVGAIGLAGHAGVAAAALAWFGGLGLGGASARFLPEPPATLLDGNRVSQPGSPMPLVLYLAVFVARFACGAWAAIKPGMAPVALSTGVAIGALVTGRLVFGALHWRRRAGA